MRCAECEELFAEQPLKLGEGGDHSLFCSFECLIAYSVGRIRLRIQRRKRRLRVLAAGQNQAKCLGARSHAAGNPSRGAGAQVLPVRA
jgi:hypothetical protein